MQILLELMQSENSEQRKEYKEKIIEKLAVPFVIALFTYMSYLFAYIFFYGYYFGNSKIPIFRMLINPIPFEVKSLVCLGTLIGGTLVMLLYLYKEIHYLDILNNKLRFICCVVMILLGMGTCTLALLYLSNSINTGDSSNLQDLLICIKLPLLTVSLILIMRCIPLNPGIIIWSIFLITYIDVFCHTYDIETNFISSKSFFLVCNGISIFITLLLNKDAIKWIGKNLFMLAVMRIIILIFNSDMHYGVALIINIIAAIIVTILLSLVFEAVRKMFNKLKSIKYLNVINLLLVNFFMVVVDFLKRKKNDFLKSLEIFLEFKVVWVIMFSIILFGTTTYVVFTMGKSISTFIPDDQYDFIYYTDQNGKSLTADGQIVGRDKNVFFVSTSDKELLIISSGKIISSSQREKTEISD